jgi:broad specificity phosphatase PhoE
MNPTVILCRHGNTFAKGDKVVMVGAREDLPLTDEGIRQARDLGKTLRDAGIELARIMSGPLKRTKVFAEELVMELGCAVPVSIEPRLTELDYGAWSGLSDEDIKERYGAEPLSRWQEANERPAGVGFSPSAEQVREDAESTLSQCASLGGISLIVSSNGRLREFGKICGADPSIATSFKMRTGSASILEYRAGRWSILAWDVRSEALARFYGEPSST